MMARVYSIISCCRWVGMATRHNFPKTVANLFLGLGREHGRIGHFKAELSCFQGSPFCFICEAEVQLDPSHLSSVSLCLHPPQGFLGQLTKVLSNYSLRNYLSLGTG